MTELKMSANDSTASATSALEWPTMPATSLAVVSTVFVTSPIKVARRPRLSLLCGTAQRTALAGKNEAANTPRSWKSSDLRVPEQGSTLATETKPVHDRDCYETPPEPVAVCPRLRPLRNGGLGARGRRVAGQTRSALHQRRRLFPARRRGHRRRLGGIVVPYRANH